LWPDKPALLCVAVKVAMEKHGVVPDVIDTAPADELEVSVMSIHCLLNGTVYCCKFLL
jgi:hypothetical protein